MLGLAAVAAVSLVVAPITLSFGSSGGKATGKPGPEGVPLETGRALASANTMARGTLIHGIQCQTSEQAVYHIHAHLAVDVDVRELQRIALGQDPTASVRDRLTALKELLKLDPPAKASAVGAVFHVLPNGSVVEAETQADESESKEG